MIMNNNSSLVKSFFTVGAGSVLSMVIGFISTPIITRLVDPGDYGLFNFFSVISAILVMLLCLGLDQSMVRFFYVGADSNLDFKTWLTRTCVKYSLIVTVMISVLISLIALVLSRQLEIDLYFLCLLSLYLPIGVFFRFVQLGARLQERSLFYSLVSVAQRLVFVLIAICCLKRFMTTGWLILVLAFVCSVLVASVIGLIGQKEMFLGSSSNISEVNERLLFTYGAPFILSLGVFSFFQASDQLMVKLYLGDHYAGIYASALTLVNVFNVVQTAFNAIWAPAAVKHYTKGGNKDFFVLGNEVVSLTLLLLGGVVVFVKDWYVMLLGPQYRSSAYLLPFLIFIPIMYTVSETTVGGLVFMKKSKVQVLISLATCCVAILCDVILLPILGMMGAAIGTLISYVVFFTLRSVIANHYFPIRFKLVRFYILSGGLLSYGLLCDSHTFVVRLVLLVLFVVILFLLYQRVVKLLVSRIFGRFCAS